MTYYPVLIPTLNRYQHFKECVESLAACTHADKTELVIGLDYPPSEKYVEGWKKIKEYIPTIVGFAKVTLFEHSQNLGSTGNSKCLQEYAANNYDAWITTEDDNVFSPCFLDYMDKCLEKYKYDKSVLAVSGYMNPVDFSLAKQCDSNILRMQDYMAWGIGKWRRTNEELDVNMPSNYMQYVCGHRRVLRKMRHNLRDLYQLIFWTKQNPSLNIRCDFTIACYCIINQKSIINPTFSLVRNMGYDGTGVNCCRLNDNYLARQEISTEKTFLIKDNLTSDQLEECRLIWESWKCKEFSVIQRKAVLKHYYAYLIFGFHIVEFLIQKFYKK